MKSSIKGRFNRFGFACLFSLVAAEWPMALAAPMINIVVMTGDPAPDGNGSFSELARAPALNDAGQVAFVASLTNTIGGNTDNSGIFRGNDTSLVQIARVSQSVPDGNGNFGPFPLDARIASINDSGQVAFTARGFSNTTGADADDSGIFRGDGSRTTLVQLLREGQSPPDGNGQFGSVGGVLNNAGQVAFYSVLMGTSAPNIDREAVFRTDGTTLIEIARGGHDAPDGNGRLIQFDNTPAINDAGQVAFAGYLIGTTGGVSDEAGIFLGDGTTLTQIARSNQPAPDGNGRYAGSPRNSTRLNDLGHMAFFATFRNTMGGIGDDTGILRSDGTSLINIVREGQMAPDGNGVFLGFTGAGFTAPAALNDLGQVAFDARLAGTIGGNSDDYGIFRGDGATLVQVVREGQASPDGNGRFDIRERPALNEAGQLTFRAFLTGTSGGTSDNTGIYFFDDALGLLQVVRTGDAFLSSTITDLGFASDDGLGDEGSGLSDSGVPRVAYFFRLADSREGIAIWTLVPEPSSLTLFVAGMLALSTCRRSSVGSRVFFGNMHRAGR